MFGSEQGETLAFFVMDITLSHKQSEAWEALASHDVRQVLYGGAAYGGKTFFGCIWVVWFSLNYPGSRNGVGRKTLTSLINSTHITLLDVIKNYFKLVEGKHFTVHMGSTKKGIEFYNGSFIAYKDLTYKPSDPTVSTLGSMLYTNFFIDEADEISHVVKETLFLRLHRYPDATTLDNWGITGSLLMTCNPSDGHLKSDFYTPWLEGTLPKDRAFIPAGVDDNPNASKEYRENIMNATGLTGKRYRGDWDYAEGGNNLFPKDSLRLIFEGSKLPTNGMKYITCDVARKGKDLSVIMVWDGYNIIDVTTYETNTTKELADAIVKKQRAYNIENNRTIIDEDGIGGGVVDLIQRVQGFNANGRPVNNSMVKVNYQNIKVQCCHHMANLPESFRFLYKGTVKGRNMHDYVRQELSSVSEVYEEGKIKITPKEKIKASIGRSPDFAECIYLRAYFDLMGGASYR